MDTALSSPESALVLSTLYDTFNNLITKNENEIIGPVLFRENEDLLSCTRIDDLIKTYNKHDVRKFYGLSITEFLDLPGWKINMLIENAEDFMKELNTDLSDIENVINTNKNKNMETLKGMG
jgi:hypothetical protein